MTENFVAYRLLIDYLLIIGNNQWLINWLPIDFIDEIRLDCVTRSLGLRVLLNARNNNKNKNRNSEYLNRLKYPSVYKNTVALSMGSCCTCCKRLVKNRLIWMKVRINRVFGYEKGLRRVFKSIPSTRLRLTWQWVILVTFRRFSTSIQWIRRTVNHVCV